MTKQIIYIVKINTELRLNLVKEAPNLETYSYKKKPASFDLPYPRSKSKTK